MYFCKYREYSSIIIFFISIFTWSIFLSPKTSIIISCFSLLSFSLPFEKHSLNFSFVCISSFNFIILSIIFSIIDNPHVNIPFLSCKYVTVSFISFIFLISAFAFSISRKTIFFWSLMSSTILKISFSLFKRVPIIEISCCNLSTSALNLSVNSFNFSLFSLITSLIVRIFASVAFSLSNSI